MSNTVESSPTIYAAIELSKATWVLAVNQIDREQPSIYKIKGGDLPGLVKKLELCRVDGGRIVVCYEAGYDGFWLARALLKLDIDCRVLDPASLQVNRRARRVKTHRIDVLMLLRALVAVERGDRHVCSVVRIPTVQEEDARRSHREQERLVRERTGHINRIKGLLFGQGIRGIEPKLRGTRIDFGALQTAEGFPLSSRLKAELEREYARLDFIEQQLRALAEEWDKPDEQEPSVEKKRKMLIQLRGIGAPSAAILAREVFGRTFSNRKQLGSYLGLTPSAYDSGSTARCQGISKAGNKAARRIMIELAWLWARYQPQAGLTHWFLTRSAGQSPRLRRILVVALSRKLIVALWRYVETGLVPEGAILSDPSSSSDGASSMT